MRRRVLAAACLCLLVACTGHDRSSAGGTGSTSVVRSSLSSPPSVAATPAATPSPAASPSATPSTSVPSTPTPSSARPVAAKVLQRTEDAPTGRGPDGRALPRPDRPRVTLAFDASRWRAGMVTGTEQVVFHPDKRVCSLVFRLWANKPAITQAGTSTGITSAAVDGLPVRPSYSADGGSPATPTMATLPLHTCVAAGGSVTARLGFTVTLADDTPERVGRSSVMDIAWLGSAFPLLAWEHGAGWMRDPAVELASESAGSEDFSLHLSVVAPAGDVVQAVGRQTGPAQVTGSTQELHFLSAAVRDVVVAVGRFDVRTFSVDGVRAHVAVPAHAAATVATWAGLTRAALSGLRTLLGPFPYDDVWVTVVSPDIGGGIEFPGATLIADTKPAETPQVLPHELAHSYFYGLVGNDQGRDPWLDESFATWAASVVIHVPMDRPMVRVADPIGEPMAFWQNTRYPDEDYAENVYWRGPYALQQARKAVGAAKFDAAVRGYVATEAHRIARPVDFERALAGLPKALAILRAAGAFVQAR